MKTQVKYRGESARLHQLSLASVLPNTGDYITYEGRLVFLLISMRIVITGRGVIVQFLFGGRFHCSETKLDLNDEMSNKHGSSIAQPSLGVGRLLHGLS